MRLPPEVLASIFSLISAHRRTIAACEQKDVEFPSLNVCISLSQVSRYFREVAISTPSLWTSIFLNSRKGAPPERVELLQALLLRSSTSPLDVHMGDLTRGINDPAFLTAISHLPRIRELHFYEQREYVEPHELSPLLNPAPLLEALVLSQYAKGSQDDSLLTLFDGCAPKLTSLVLSGYPRYSGNKFRNLRQLSLTQIMYRTLEDVKGFLGLLDASPTLEDVLFRNMFFPTLPDLSRRSNMPRLKRLITELQHSSERFILSCLSLYPGVAYDCSPYHTGKSLQATFPRDKSHLGDLLHPTTVELDFHDDFCRVTAASQSSIFRAALHKNDPYLPPRSQEYLSMEDLASTFFSGGSVRELWLQFKCVDQRPHFLEARSCWYPLLLPAATLTKLVLIYRPSHCEDHPGLALARSSFLQLLALIFVESKSPVCPLLNEIHIYGLPEDIRESFFAMVKSRKKCGHPIPIVYLYQVRGEAGFGNTSAEDGFKSWRDGLDYLRPFVGEVVLEVVEKYPCIQLPQVCTSTGEGRLAWPRWVDSVDESQINTNWFHSSKF
ncbi:hypothetical protein PHLCEN_2v12242 [Hermanssonia centrifuga]|uniref:F-box domain-containing protein n=1 Tax=Hermanssonia centrifuga TaxID=98765 RepID=A0A2R6NI14_9APHY|nr:hypothetical protein PHLCEN_2v12242 [Hermanssonia centrifuga]